MDIVRWLFYGILLGIANLIPGVSGSTVAVILNVYDKILYSLSFKNIRTNLNFLVPLISGTFGGVLLFSKLVAYLYQYHSDFLNYGFAGLIFGSLPMIYRKAGKDRLSSKNWLVFTLSLFFMLALVIVKYIADSSSNQHFISDGVSLLPIHLKLLWIFISCFVSMIAMMLPGISGSFVLLLLGCYTPILLSLSTFDFPILISALAGVVMGAFVGLRIINIMLREHPQAMYMGILGLIMGSVFGLLPFFNQDWHDVPSFLLMSLCAAAGYLFSRKV